MLAETCMLATPHLVREGWQWNVPAETLMPTCGSEWLSMADHSYLTRAFGTGTFLLT